MIQRDAYVKYLEQLSTKGTIVPNPFISQIADQPHYLTTETLDFRGTQTYSNNASSNHNYLTERELDDAHPQYLLKTGGTINGDLFLDGSLTLNGARISDLFYQKNGLPKIGSYAIDWNSVSNADVAEAGYTVLPQNLSVVSKRVLPNGKVQFTLKFDVEDDSSVNYEFEIIEV